MDFDLPPDLVAYLAELEFDANTAVDLAAGLPVQAALQP